MLRWGGTMDGPAAGPPSRVLRARPVGLGHAALAARRDSGRAGLSSARRDPPLQPRYRAVRVSLSAGIHLHRRAKLIGHVQGVR